MITTTTTTNIVIYYYNGRKLDLWSLKSTFLSESWIYQTLLENKILPRLSQGNSKKHLVITFNNTEY